MKKKKCIILTTIIISLLILLVPRGTYAVTETNFIYSDSVINDISNNQQLYKNVANYIKNNANVFENQFSDLDITNDKVTLVYGGLSYSVGADGYVRVFMIPSTRNLTLSYNGGWYSLSFSSYDYRFTYNVDTLEITGIDIIPTGISSNATSKSKNGNNLSFSYFYLDWHMGKNTDSLFENNTNDNIIANSSDLLITHNSSYNLHQFAWNMDSEWVEEEQEPFTCNKTQVLGMFENPSEFTINISGIGNALKEPLKGIITISYEASNFINANQWEITDTISENTTGNYQLKCSTEQQKCELYFNYNYEDDIEQEINMNFKFKTINGINMPTFVRLYSCLKNYNDINITYENTKNTNSGQTATENKIDNIVGGIGNILNFLNPANLIYIVIPTEEQMQSLLNEMQESINNKLGILGLPLTIYTRIMNLTNTSTQENWCLSWNGVKVPNFEDFEIIGTGSWCFSEILENEQINTFRNVCINIIGGLILLAFIQYLNNTYHKIIESPDRDEYQYITTEDVYTVNNETGELTNHVWKKRRTTREKVEK